MGEVLALPWVTALYNIVTYNIALILLLAWLSPARLWVYILFAMVLTPACFFLIQYQAWFMVPYVVLSALVLRFREKSWLAAITKSASAVCILLVAGLILSSAAILIAPSLYGGLAFNYLMGGGELVMTMALYAVLRKKSVIPNDRLGLGLLLFAECFILVFYTFILHRLQIGSIHTMAIANLFATILCAAIIVLMGHINRLDRNAAKTKLKLEHEMETRMAMEAQFERTAVAQHFFRKLYTSVADALARGDYGNAQTHLDRYVTPMHNRLFLADDRTAAIEDKLLRGLLESTFAAMSMQQPTIKQDIQVRGTVRLPETLSLGVFNLVGTFLDNAMEALDKQGGGKLAVHLVATGGYVAIKIDNTVPTDFDFAVLNTNAQPWDEHGHGLRLAQRIVAELPAVEHYTFMEPSETGQRLVQRLVIHTDEGGAGDV